MYSFVDQATEATAAQLESTKLALQQHAAKQPAVAEAPLEPGPGQVGICAGAGRALVVQHCTDRSVCLQVDAVVQIVEGRFCLSLKTDNGARSKRVRTRQQTSMAALAHVCLVTLKSLGAVAIVSLSHVSASQAPCAIEEWVNMPVL
jgi:hypothetical protein